jgi:hypothetical protein
MKARALVLRLQSGTAVHRRAASATTVVASAVTTRRRFKHTILLRYRSRFSLSAWVVVLAVGLRGADDLRLAGRRIVAALEAQPAQLGGRPECGCSTLATCQVVQPSEYRCSRTTARSR